MTANTDSTALGNLYWYRHKGWQNGSQDWGDGGRLVGEGGWQEYKSVFASSDGAMYAIDWDGNLWWDRYQTGQTGGGDGWSGRSLVGEGGWAAYKSVFATAKGILYAVDWDGNLYWYRHQGWQTGTNEWGKGRQLVGEGGWQEYTSVFATSDGVLYAITPDGDLYWYQHKGWETGTNEWAEKGRQLVGQDGWQAFRSVFATGDGVLYAVTHEGNLYWYKHEDWQTGAGKLGDGKLVGEGGWQTYASVFATGDGVLYAIHNNVATRIKHIVYLMLENRSLDHVLGWLYADGQRPARVIAPPGYDNPNYNGLRENTYYNLDSSGNKQWVVRGTESDYSPLRVPYHDPNEDYVHINMQLFESESNPVPGQTPTMGGFYQDFYPVSYEPWQIMQTYEPHQLKVLSGAARNWAVSDAYHSSVPTQTNCNRGFATTGNSIAPDTNNNNQLVGWVNNDMGLTGWLYVVFNQRSMFNVLRDAGKDWLICASELWEQNWCFTRDMLSQIQGEEFDSNFGTIQTFLHLAATGDLPSVTFLEPEWGYAYEYPFGHQGTDYHPPMNVPPGEDFVAKILSAVRSGRNWNETLLIINFDEHGGTYDHVRPPWNAAVPWGGDSATPAPATTELGFGFDRFGVRVPLILVSPLIEANTVFRAGYTPFDHTSVIATILTMLGIPKNTWKLGNRVQRAPTFENVLTRGAPRTDQPDIEPSDAVKAALEVPPPLDTPPTDLQREIAIRRLRHHLRLNKDPGARPPEDIIAPLAAAKTLSELSKALAEALGKKDIY